MADGAADAQLLTVGIPHTKTQRACPLAVIRATPMALLTGIAFSKCTSYTVRAPAVANITFTSPTWARWPPRAKSFQPRYEREEFRAVKKHGYCGGSSGFCCVACLVVDCQYDTGPDTDWLLLPVLQKDRPHQCLSVKLATVSRRNERFRSVLRTLRQRPGASDE